MQITNTVLKTLEGDDLKNSSNPPGAPPKDSDPVLMVSDVLSNICLYPAPQGQPYEPAKAAARYELAVSVFGKKEGEFLEVPSDMCVELDRDIARYYPVLVAGQMHRLLK